MRINVNVKTKTGLGDLKTGIDIDESQLTVPLADAIDLSMKTVGRKIQKQFGVADAKIKKEEEAAKLAEDVKFQSAVSVEVEKRMTDVEKRLTDRIQEAAKSVVTDEANKIDSDKKPSTPNPIEAAKAEVKTQVNTEEIQQTKPETQAEETKSA